MCSGKSFRDGTGNSEKRVDVGTSEMNTKKKILLRWIMHCGKTCSHMRIEKD